MGLRIATWNVEHASARRWKHRESVRAAIDETPADVWVLTESDPSFVPGDDFRLLARSAEPRERQTGRAWVAIWGRVNLVADEIVDLAADPSRTAATLLRPAGRDPILVYGTVLPWRSDTLWPGNLSEAFGHALDKQSLEWEALRNTYRAELCVAGDFNQELTGPIRVGSRAGRDALRSVLREQHLSCPTSDPHDAVGTILERGSIDHILLSAGLRPVTSTDGRPRIRVIPLTIPLPRTLSDHYGVCVEVTPARATSVAPSTTLN